ncbi:MAG: ABC transporter ATP-binding protein [Clostridia bacterium]|nr:ABC transporter ATP-binding protein [Clostridia bacterium]
MNEILRLVGVTHRYHGKTGETEAIRSMDLSVEEGEFLGIVGPSGSGKTTLLSILAGILEPSSGRVERNIAPSEIGYMLQRDHLFEWRTIEENVVLGLEIRKIKTAERVQYARSLLEKYSLGDFIKKKPSELSGGMRQRVALIRTLALRPKLILLDEPFSALDFQTRLNVAEDVREIITEEKVTAILVTHDISEAIALCDRVAVLSARPATVKKIFENTIDKSLSSIERREHPLFATLFKEVWKELEFTNEKERNTDQ